MKCEWLQSANQSNKVVQEVRKFGYVGRMARRVVRCSGPSRGWGRSPGPATFGRLAVGQNYKVRKNVPFWKQKFQQIFPERPRENVCRPRENVSPSADAPVAVNVHLKRQKWNEILNIPTLNSWAANKIFYAHRSLNRFDCSTVWQPHCAVGLLFFLLSIFEIRANFSMSKSPARYVCLTRAKVGSKQVFRHVKKLRQLQVCHS